MKQRPIDGDALKLKILRTGVVNGDYFAGLVEKQPTIEIPSGVLSCCGFKMFRGELKFNIIKDKYATMEGTFIYLPDDDVWMDEDGNQFSGRLCKIEE